MEKKQNKHLEKTGLCQYMERRNRKEKCWYAHSIDELVPYPGNAVVIESQKQLRQKHQSKTNQQFAKGPVRQQMHPNPMQMGGASPEMTILIQKKQLIELQKQKCTDMNEM